MGQIETKVFVRAPPWAIRKLTSKTDLDAATVDVCWTAWTRSKLVRRNRLDLNSFVGMMNIEEEEERREAIRLFELLDDDEDQGVDFEALITCLFAMDKDLSKEQKLRRSFHLYDRNDSGKITKDEMVEALANLEKIKVQRDGYGKLVIPGDVENLFSLMDFQHDGKIEESEFMRCTLHYRRLGQMLTLQMLENRRQHYIDKINDWKKQKEENSGNEEDDNSDVDQD